MAGILVTAVATNVQLSAATPLTVLQVLAPTNQRLVVSNISVWFEGISSVAEPVQVSVVRQTGDPAGTGITLVSRQAITETIQSSADHTATAEPTVDATLMEWRIHPQSGIPFVFPIGQEIHVPGGGRLGIKITSATIVQVTAQLDYYE
jgi:hypothetical protein